MINSNNAYKDDLVGTSWIGEVVDIEDPNKIGRIKVNVYGKFDDIPTEDIPWAYPGNNYTGGSSTGGGFFSVPKKGSIVSVKFDNGNIYHPEYFFNQKISDEVKSEIENSYANAHIIVYDTVTDGSLKIFFTEEKGIMLDYKKTQINIKNDNSVLIQTASGNSKVEIFDDGKLTITQSNDIELTTNTNVNVNCKIATVTAETKAIIDSQDIRFGGDDATEQLVLGNLFKTFFDSHIHLTPQGPTDPPVIKMNQLSKVSKTK